MTFDKIGGLKQTVKKAEMKETLSEKPVKTLVSIIIPFYNREKFLSESVESVLAQTVKEWELFLIDDGSTDKTAEIAAKFAEKYPNKIFLLNHQDNQNKGASAARNLGIANATGEYITFLDSDDVFFPDTLERELRAFAENPEADAVCGTMECWFSWSSEADKRENDFTIDLVLETEKLYQPPDLFVHNLKAGGRKPGINCVMLKRNFAEEIGAFEAEYKYTWEDQVFWAKLTLNGKIYVMNAVLAKYRQHSASISDIQMKDGRDILSMTVFFDWLADYLQKRKIRNNEVRRAVLGFRRKIRWETKLKKFKQIYRRIFSLHTRYKIRDLFTKTKKILLRSAHRQK